MPTRRRSLLWYGLPALAAAGLLWLTHGVCLGTWFSKGLVLEQCPEGDLRQTVTAMTGELRRGAPGWIRVTALAHFTTGPSDEDRVAVIPKAEAAVSLIDGSGKSTPLPPKEGWKRVGGQFEEGSITLPADLVDGDYTLRVLATTSVGKSSVDLPLPVFAPAKVHVITDRPLYQPGNEVKFRAVVLRARDLKPLDSRPGKWVVTDPDGEVLLEEKAPAGEWGVVAGSFPLDPGAPTGTWKVRWESGPASDEVAIRVEPFTLPRFRVDAAAQKSFYQRGDKPLVKGSVVYSSGAPVEGAKVRVTWSTPTAWPLPTDWIDARLPKQAVTDASGSFSLALPEVPGDLQGQATLQADLEAVDPAGDRVEGSASVLLSEDALQVSAVTDLGDGLVGGFNNRLYLRATTADGQVLANTALRVVRAWDSRDPGVDTQTDEDGVAALQLDPGPAVNVIIPPVPYRPPPPIKIVSRSAARELIANRDASLADQLGMDRWLAALEPCARYVTGSAQTVGMGIRVDPSGAMFPGVGQTGPLAQCVGQKLTALRLPPGTDRLYSLSLTFQPPDLPVLNLATEQAPAGEQEVVEDLTADALEARGCLPSDMDAAELPRALEWRVKAGQREVSLTWVKDPGGDAVAERFAACVQSRFPPPRLAVAPTADSLGIARLGVSPAARGGAPRPQATTLLGYELKVEQTDQGKAIASTLLRVRPGMVPPIRLRATPVLAEAGNPVAIELVRGPGFSGKLPKTLQLAFQDPALKPLEGKLDPETHVARFNLPARVEGWLSCRWNGAEARVYVRPQTELQVSVTPDKERYGPGQKASLAILTRQGQGGSPGVGHPAAVGLFGVDASLGQLVTLPGPDDMARIRPQVTTSAPAFGSLDGQALAMGRIRGANAAAATILRVSAIPGVEALDTPTQVNGQGTFDPQSDLTDHFYTVLNELHDQARAWETQAPTAEKMHPPAMAKLWARALEACQRRGEKMTDAYGRPLRLSQLPSDLLALVDPRAVIVDGKRLPEDVEDWAQYVQEARP